MCRGEAGALHTAVPMRRVEEAKEEGEEGEEREKKGLVHGRWLTHSHLAPSDTHSRTRSLTRSLSHSRAALFLTVVVVVAAAISPLFYCC